MTHVKSIGFISMESQLTYYSVMKDLRERLGLSLPMYFRLDPCSGYQIIRFIDQP